MDVNSVKDVVILDTKEGGEEQYLRIRELPRLMDLKDIDYYRKREEAWRNSGKKQAVTKKFQNAKTGAALEAVLEKFRDATPGVSQSMEQNFVVKLLFWLDRAEEGFLKNWEPEKNSRFVYCGSTAKQEYLFCYLLTLLGVNVLICRQDGDKEPAAPLKQLLHTVKAEVRPAVRTLTVNVRRPERDERTRRSLQSRQTQQDGEKRELSFEELAQLASSVVMITIHDREGKPLGSGSGIMISPDGYILTNNHVASGGYSYSVRVEEDDRVYQTDEMIKYNQFLDLAIIRIDRKLKPVPFYQGQRPLVRGQKVVAIGSPLGLFNSVSDGIISGFRKIDEVNMIQFTAPISHGSSGGAVLNMYGEVIGISTAGIDSGQNINLAVGYEEMNNFIRGFYKV